MHGVNLRLDVRMAGRHLGTGTRWDPLFRFTAGARATTLLLATVIGFSLLGWSSCRNSWSTTCSDPAVWRLRVGREQHRDVGFCALVEAAGIEREREK
jgi:hypothetical protein